MFESKDSFLRVLSKYNFSFRISYFLRAPCGTAPYKIVEIYAFMQGKLEKGTHCREILKYFVDRNPSFALF